MPNFRVHFTIIRDQEVSVEAKDEEQAMALVKEQSFNQEDMEDATTEYYMHSVHFAEELTY
jgi:hypothetical protein